MQELGILTLIKFPYWRFTAIFTKILVAFFTERKSNYKINLEPQKTVESNKTWVGIT